MSGQKKLYANIAFKKRGRTYQGSVPLGELPLLIGDPAKKIHTATTIYHTAIGEIRQWQKDTKPLNKSRTALLAWKAWELGDIVYRLQSDLASHSFRIENLYDHLARHSGTPRWVRTYVTFRRYVDDVSTIPENLKWNSIEKSPKAAGQAISSGLFVES